MTEGSSYLDAARRKGRARISLPSDRQMLCDIGVLVTEVIFELGPRIRPNVIHLQLLADEILILVDPLEIQAVVEAIVDEILHTSRSPTKVAISIVREREQVGIAIKDQKPRSAGFLVPLPSPTPKRSSIAP